MVSVEIIVGFSSSIIALCALFLSIYQGYQTRKHNKLSVRPHLVSSTYTNGDKGHFYIEIVNNGIGPALIENFVITVDGHVINGKQTAPIEHALKLIFPPRFKRKTKTTYMSHGYCLAPTERCVFLEIQFENDAIPTQEEFKKATDRANLKIIYKSFYGEEYVFDSSKE